MAIGYACKTIGVADTDMRTCMMKAATNDKLKEIIIHNIASFDRTIDYNIDNNIRLFRISSDFIPFGSSPINSIPWWEDYREELKSIGQKIKDSSMRVSLHPGQYTVLNSLSSDVVNRAIDDLTYHTRILDSLGVDSSHKIILHIGGAYNDKKASAKRFIENYRLLDESIKKRLVIENDDKIYNIQEVLDIGMQSNIPVIFDNLHNEINPSDEEKSEFSWIEECRNTWRAQDGKQKIHYSQQAEQKQKGSHSDYIGINRFMDFYNKLIRNDIDIMIEVKDKNLSCVKCINCTTEHLSKALLEKEWNKYKYTILERSPSSYDKISKMFEASDDLSSIIFYNYMEQSLQSPGDLKSHIYAIQMVWDDITEYTTEKETTTFYRNLEKYQNQQVGINTVKNQLRKLADKYELEDLRNSYFFLM